jgi:hypothetical protein
MQHKLTLEILSIKDKEIMAIKVSNGYDNAILSFGISNVQGEVLVDIVKRAAAQLARLESDRLVRGFLLNGSSY